MKMEKLLIISNDFPPMLSGVADYTGKLCEKLSQQFTILLAANRIGYERQPYITDYFLFSTWHVFAMLKLFRIIKKEDPKAIILQYTPNMYNWKNLGLILLASLLKLKGKKLILVGHELFLPNYASWVGRVLQRFINNMRDYLLIKLSAGVIVTFKKRLLRLQKIRANVVAIPVGSNIAYHKVPQAQLLVLKENLKLKSELVLGYYGIPHEDKNYGLLLDVAAQLENIKFLLIGPEDGRFRQLVEKSGMANKFVFAGFVPSNALPAYFALLDIYLNVDRRGISTRKGSLITLMEHRVPILSALDPEFFDDIFEPDKHFTRIDLSVTKIVNVIEGLRKERAKLQTISNNAYQLFQNKFSWGSIAQQYAAYISKVC